MEKDEATALAKVFSAEQPDTPAACLNLLPRPDKVFEWSMEPPDLGFGYVLGLSGMPAWIRRLAFDVGVTPVLDQRWVLTELIRRSLHRMRCPEESLKYMAVKDGWGPETRPLCESFGALEALPELCELWGHGVERRGR